MTDAELLALVDAQIAALLSGGAVQEWSEGGHQVRHMKLGELMQLKRELENRIAQAASGGMMCMPIREVDV